MTGALVPYGEFNPPRTPIDPAEYPYKVLIEGADMDASTAILWFDSDPLPFDPDLTEFLLSTFAGKGHALLMARCPVVLTRAYQAALMVAGAALSLPAGTPS